MTARSPYSVLLRHNNNTWSTLECVAVGTGHQVGFSGVNCPSSSPSHWPRLKPGSSALSAVSQLQVREDAAVRSYERHPIIRCITSWMTTSCSLLVVSPDRPASIHVKYKYRALLTQSETAARRRICTLPA